MLNVLNRIVQDINSASDFAESMQIMVQRVRDAVETEAGDIMLDIESNIASLAELGIRQEICAVATRVFGIENNTIVDGLTLVGDGFISLIGYQAQGYHLVPVF